MRKSINLTTDKSTPEMLGKIKEAGFDGLDIGYSKGFLDNWEKNSHELREKLEKAGLCTVQVHLPYYSLFDPSNIFREEKDEEIKNALRSMDVLGASWGAYHPMSATDIGYDHNRAMVDNAEHLKMYLEVAEECNVGIAVENIPVFPDCPQYDFFTADFSEHCRLVDSMKSDKIGICWDFGHANLINYDHCEVLKVVGDRIKILHVHNNFGDYDRHLCPGIGEIKWEELLPALSESGYKGDLSLEVNLNFVRPEVLDGYIKICGISADSLLSLFKV